MSLNRSHADGFMSASILLADIFNRLWRFTEDPSTSKLECLQLLLKKFQKEWQQAEGIDRCCSGVIVNAEGRLVGRIQDDGEGVRAFDLCKERIAEVKHCPLSTCSAYAALVQALQAMGYQVQAESIDSNVNRSTLPM